MTGRLLTGKFFSGKRWLNLPVSNLPVLIRLLPPQSPEVGLHDDARILGEFGYGVGA
jgi:hypothetical protein